MPRERHCRAAGLRFSAIPSLTHQHRIPWVRIFAMSMSTGANGLANAARMKDWSRHLGRFTEGRTVVLERLRDELRKRDYVPIVFNFDKPETKDFTETVRLLAGSLAL